MTNKLAQLTVADLVANTIAKCELVVFEKYERVEDSAYYIFNIEPNKQFNGTIFWYKVVYQMMTKGSCLVIRDNQSYRMADSYMYDETQQFYTDVYINDQRMAKNYSEKEVFHFMLTDRQLDKELDAGLKTYEELFKRACSTYARTNASKKIINFRNLIVPKNVTSEEYMNAQAREHNHYTDTDDSVVITTGEYDAKDSETKAAKDISDIETVINQSLQIVAMRYHLPISLFSNNAISDEQMNDFITFTISPMVAMMQKEINRKYFKKDKYLSGSRIIIDTTKIKHIDILDNASSLEALYRIGFTYNELQDMLNRPRKTDEWADESYVTKNYSKI